MVDVAIRVFYISQSCIFRVLTLRLLYFVSGRVEIVKSVA